MTDKQDQGRRHGKAREQALVLTLIGALLLMPPFASIFDIDGKIAGLPITMVYVFAVWALLILCTLRLSRRLSDNDGDGR